MFQQMSMTNPFLDTVKQQKKNGNSGKYCPDTTSANNLNASC